MNRARLASLSLVALALSVGGTAVAQAHGDHYPGSSNPCDTTDPHAGGGATASAPIGAGAGTGEVWAGTDQVAYQDNYNHVGARSNGTVEFSNQNNETYLTQAKVSSGGVCFITRRPELPGGGEIHFKS